MKHRFSHILWQRFLEHSGDLLGPVKWKEFYIIILFFLLWILVIITSGFSVFLLSSLLYLWPAIILRKLKNLKQTQLFATVLLLHYMALCCGVNLTNNVVASQGTAWLFSRRFLWQAVRSIKIIWTKDVFHREAERENELFFLICFHFHWMP